MPTKTPDQIDLRQHEKSGRYYDGGRYADDAAVDLALDRGQTRWWIGYMDHGGEQMVAEEDVVAPSKSEASAVFRAALARDFDPGCTLNHLVLA